MNMILLHPDDFIDDITVEISDYRFQHIAGVLKKTKGASLKTGLINSTMGTGTIIDINNNFCRISVSLDDNPPDPAPCRVIMALPRPKMFRRVLFTLTSLGIKEIYIINTWRVDKSYWQSPYLEPRYIESAVNAALEQCCDTVSPAVYFKKLFRPFVEDELKLIIKGSMPVAAHPGCPDADLKINLPVSLAVGPEGGFNSFEIDMLKNIGFNLFSMGERILRVEDAVPALIGRLIMP